VAGQYPQEVIPLYSSVGINPSASATDYGTFYGKMGRSQHVGPAKTQRTAPAGDGNGHAHLNEAQRQAPDYEESPP